MWDAVTETCVLGHVACSAGTTLVEHKCERTATCVPTAAACGDGAFFRGMGMEGKCVCNSDAPAPLPAPFDSDLNGCYVHGSLTPEGDFDGDGSFTMRDAVFVIDVWSNRKSFKWEQSGDTCEVPCDSDRRRLTAPGGGRVEAAGGEASLLTEVAAPVRPVLERYLAARKELEEALAEHVSTSSS